MTDTLSPPIAQYGHNSSQGPLLGKTLCFPSGTRWLLTKALTPLTYQQGEPPFEARQVFECVCILDSGNRNRVTKDAVIKIKYQVRGICESTLACLENLEYCRKMLPDGDSPQYRCKLSNLEDAEKLYHDATHPVETPHRYTTNEIIALRQLRKLKCAYTPHLMDIGGFALSPKIDEQAMVGGYMVGMVMTKVPGRRITWDYLWHEKTRDERDEIREGFKTALLQLWRCCIYPQDCALRNIMWDEEQGKCYIVDFEDWIRVDGSDVEALWNLHPQWGLWQLSEDRGPSWFKL